MKIERATPEEVRAHDGVYPLYGFVEMEGCRVIVEDLTDGDPEFCYEALAPDGKLFADNDARTLLASTQAVLFERLREGFVEDPDADEG